MWNLLSNAVKFTPEGGTVEVKVSSVGGRWKLAVTDSGRGIADEFLPHVFDRFRQADGISTRTEGGLGLGLAIVAHLVQLHGGTVEATSAGEGKGATFTVDLPIRTLNSEPPKAPWMRSPQRERTSLDDSTRLDGVRILFVDDQPDAREMLSELLQLYGASIVAVESAEQAYRALEQGTFDLLISDIGLPKENGYDLIRKVRALPPERGGRIPAVAVTGFARTEDGRKALAEGFQNHLAKPVEPAELLALVASLSGRSEVGRSG